eukprot:4247245-Amphidinium_carterae.1
MLQLHLFSLWKHNPQETDTELVFADTSTCKCSGSHTKDRRLFSERYFDCLSTQLHSCPQDSVASGIAAALWWCSEHPVIFQ